MQNTMPPRVGMSRVMVPDASEVATKRLSMAVVHTVRVSFQSDFLQF